MELAAYARIVWKRAWIIVLIAVIGGLGAIGFSKLQTPIYRSTIRLSAIPARPDYGQGLAAKAFLRNYSLQIVSSSLLQQVIDQMQLDVPPAALRDRINVSSDEADLTITIEVKHPQVNITQELPQKLGEAFVVKHREENLQIDQRDRILVDLLDNATPVELYSPRTSVNAAAGGILGLLIGLFVAFFIEWLESDIIRTAEDAEKQLGVTTLGLIPTMTEKEARAT
jgi:capsular polysaccharide biosynthesis protein